jgi:sugar (pentulose or hexulose) kinase
VTGPRHVGVIDIAKAVLKVALIDVETRSEVAARRAPNLVTADGPYPHYDTDAAWEFFCDALAELNTIEPIEALSVTTHGAAAALLDARGNLALPVLDYEFAGPEELAAEYDAVRPPFAESFTPRLPAGLNLGAQLYWQARRFAEPFAATRWVVPYPQYWAYRLSGVVAAEITSLGCHTDLWNFETDLYSSLVIREGWLDKMPEVRRASDILGPLQPELAGLLGFRRPVPVCCGIHNTNASLLPQLIGRRDPFSMVATGTWFVCGAPGADLSGLDPRRDCLANIDAFGRPYPSARFMGGREFSLIVEGDTPKPTEAGITRVLSQPVMLLPSVVEGSGPFPNHAARWTVPRETLDRETIAIAASFYIALMTAECLELAGADGEIAVDGPLAGNGLFLEMLAAATARPVTAARPTADPRDIGAALLADLDDAKPATLDGVAVAPHQVAAMVHYAQRWRQLVGD